MPPEIVGEILRAAVNLPFSQNLEAVRVHDEDAAGAVAGGGAESAAKNSFGAAVDGVRAGVAGPLGENRRLDDLDDSRLARVWLGVNDMDSGGLDAGDD